MPRAPAVLHARHAQRHKTMGRTMGSPSSYTPIQDGFRQVAPAYTALSPSSSSMRMSWLYFALRSERHGAPVLIWPVHKPTAMSAIVTSSVSPERCEHITPQPLFLQSVTASMDSLREPIWFTFRRRALQAFSSIALLTRVTLVTVRSSPT